MCFMSLQFQIEASLMILLTIVLSGLIGINRERFDHPAGLRTHILVAVGSCVFTILSIYAFVGGDPARVAAQVVSGLGFLGAGAILKRGSDISGMTTAASLWATASIGMAVGSGAWFFAIMITVMLWGILVMVRHFEVHVLETKRPKP